MARRPQTKPAERVAPEIGRTGLSQQGGVIREEFLADLKGSRAVKIYREMRNNDYAVGALMFVVEMVARQVSWTCTPASDSPEDEEAAEFLESCLGDMSQAWGETVAEILSFLTYGWSFHEIVYKFRGGPTETDPSRRSRYSDGLIGWRKMPIRSQDSLQRWDFDDTGGLRGMWQLRSNQVPVYIPIERGLLFRTTTFKGNPEGRSILRNAYRPWFYKKRIEEIEAIGVERDLAGLPYASVPARIMSPSASADERAVYEGIREIVRSIRQDDMAGVVFPSDTDAEGNPLYELKLMSTGGKRQFDTGAIISRYDRAILMAALADFILLGHEKVGSFALSSSKTDLFAYAIGTFLGEVASVLNRHAVPRLFDANGRVLEKLPELSHGDIETADIAEIAGAMADFTAAGFNMLDVEDEIRRRVGLPERVEDEADGSLARPEADPEDDDGEDPPATPGRRQRRQSTGRDVS